MFVLGFQLGKGTGIARPPHPSIIEFGPVLNHIFVDKDIGHGFPTFGLVDARSKRLKELNKVVMVFADRPAEIIRELISPRLAHTDKESYTPQAMTSLSPYEQSFEDAAGFYLEPSLDTHEAGSVA